MLNGLRLINCTRDLRKRFVRTSVPSRSTNICSIFLFNFSIHFRFYPSDYVDPSPPTGPPATSHARVLIIEFKERLTLQKPIEAVQKIRIGVLRLYNCEFCWSSTDEQYSIPCPKQNRHRIPFRISTSLFYHKILGLELQCIPRLRKFSVRRNLFRVRLDDHLLYGTGFKWNGGKAMGANSRQKNGAISFELSPIPQKGHGF